MDPIALQILGFIVAALILIWAVIELSKRYSPRKKAGPEVLTTWAPLDPTPVNSTEEFVVDEDSENQSEVSEPGIHTRAQQNGHYSESKKPL